MTSDELRSRLATAAILPILTVREIDATLRQVEALAGAGVSAVEIVLRTPAAIEAIRAVRTRFPDLLLGAGTVISPATFDLAAGSGADVVISPGLPAPLLAHHRGHALPLIPGVLSPTEVMTASDAGYRLLKYYPAVPSNGDVVLSDYANLFPGVTFVPTGKISLETLPAYARLQNVTCVGGSWMLKSSVEETRDAVRRSLDIALANRFSA